MKKLLIIIILGGLLSPLIAFAGVYKASGVNVCYEGLVPCGLGKELYVGGEWKDGKCVGGTLKKDVPCQFCHFFVMFKGIIDFVIKLVIVIAVLMFTIGGFMFFFAGGNPASLEKAKKILTSTAIGLVIILGAWLIINSILTFPGLVSPEFKSLDPTKWFQIDCTIKI